MDLVKTQEIHNAAFINCSFAMSTNVTVNPAEFDYLTATVTGGDYQTLMSDIQAMNVGQILAHLINTELIK